MTASANAVKALYSFLSSFGIPAYEENSVPDDDSDGVKVEPPYITYNIIIPDWTDSSSISATIWYKTTSTIPPFEKADEIGKKIGEGLRVPVPGGGCLWLNKGTPFSMMIPAADDRIKAVTLNIDIQAIC